MPGRLLRTGGRSALHTPVGTFGGQARVRGLWLRRSVTQAAGAFTSWADIVGRSPNIVPTGAVTVDANGCVCTNGVSSYIATAAAAFPLDGTPITLVVWGEMLGAAAGWGGLVSDLTNAPAEKLAWQSAAGTMGVAHNATTTTVAKAQPGAGVRSCWIVTLEPYDLVGSAQTGGKVTVRCECVGRGPGMSVTAASNTGATTQGGTGSGGRQLPAQTIDACPTFTTASAYLCFGKLGALFGALKLCGILALDGVLGPGDRAAIETLVALDSVSLYGAAGSTGAVIMLGDSTIDGAFADVYASGHTTPPDPAATTIPGHLQRLINAAGRPKPSDLVPWGQGGQDAYDLLNRNNTQARNGQTRYMPNVVYSFLHSALAFCSPARRAAGLPEIVVCGHWTNDIGHYALGAGSSPTLYSLTTLLVQLAHAVGTKIAVSTMPPRDNFLPTAPGGAATKETARLAYNTSVRGNAAGADVVIDHSTKVDTYNGNVLPFQDPNTATNSCNAQNGGSTPWPYTEPRALPGQRYSHDGTHWEDDGTTAILGNRLLAESFYSALLAANAI
jgi:hypothetical protein